MHMLSSTMHSSKVNASTAGMHVGLQEGECCWLGGQLCELLADAESAEEDVRFQDVWLRTFQEADADGRFRMKMIRRADQAAKSWPRAGDNARGDACYRFIATLPGSAVNCLRAVTWRTASFQLFFAVMHSSPCMVDQQPRRGSPRQTIYTRVHAEGGTQLYAECNSACDRTNTRLRREQGISELCQGHQ